MNLNKFYRETLNEEHSKAFEVWYQLSYDNKTSDIGMQAERMIEECIMLLAELNANESANRKDSELHICQGDNQY